MTITCQVGAAFQQSLGSHDPGKWQAPEPVINVYSTLPPLPPRTGSCSCFPVAAPLEVSMIASVYKGRKPGVEETGRPTRGKQQSGLAPTPSGGLQGTFLAASLPSQGAEQPESTSQTSL